MEEIRTYLLNEFFKSNLILPGWCNITAFYNYFPLINKIFDEGLIYLPSKLNEKISNIDAIKLYPSGINLSITSNGLCFINKEQIIKEINDNLSHFPKKTALFIENDNFMQTGNCSEDEINSLFVYYTSLSLAIEFFGLYSNLAWDFKTKYGLMIYNGKVYFQGQESLFQSELNKLLKDYSTRQIGLAAKRIGANRPADYTKIKDVLYYCLTQIIITRKNQFSTKIEKIDAFLFGNGVSIGLTKGSAFTNSNLTSIFFNLLSSQEKEKIISLINFLNYFLFDFLSEDDKKAFNNRTMDTENAKRLLAFIDEANYYDYLINRFTTKITLSDIGLEDLELIEDLYHDFADVINFSLKNESLIINYSDYLTKTILIEQKNYTKQVIFKNDLFVKCQIFTTNYDDLLERNFPDLVITHMHGSVREKNIITASSYQKKAKDILREKQRSGFYYYRNELLNDFKFQKFIKIKGVLGIVGYSCSYNDEHINSFIRSNPNISLIIFFYKDRPSKEEQIKTIRRLTSFEDNKKVYFVSVDTFYNQYCIEQ